MAFIIPKKATSQPVIASQATSQVAIETEQETEAAVLRVIPAPQEKEIAPAANQLDMLIQVNLEALTKKLETAIPDIRTEMITIHKALAKDPAQVTILSPDECATIFAGYSKLSGIELVAKAAAKKGSKTPVSIEMFE